MSLSEFIQLMQYSRYTDAIGLGDTEEALLQALLISRNMDDATLSIHGPMQAAVTRKPREKNPSELFRPHCPHTKKGVCHSPKFEWVIWVACFSGCKCHSFCVYRILSLNSAFL